ncbi:hypothetical protein B566_EDAN012934, partial [Ephemera danica]
METFKECIFSDVTDTWRNARTRTTEQYDFMRRSNIQTDCKIKIVSEDEGTPYVVNVHRLQLIRASPVKLNTFDEACEVAFAAEKYQIKQLRDISVSIVLKLLSPENVWSALKLANILGLQNLRENCIE